ncbi:hypothetical protein [Pantoea sp. Mhis]|uniref:hypothetical protein n=1 Tax=Pantoea sp. Mhis TaxID=2576759 RepID=UPI0013585F96|nr:hypothetical protein [Pantoea sp. Mhis]
MKQLINGTSHVRIEAILHYLLFVDYNILVLVFAYLDYLLCQMARLCRTNMHSIEVQ